MPEVTIGIPVYNEEKHLSSAIESVLSQSFDDIEVIVSDNCSTDSSLSIAREFSKADPRVRVLRQNLNVGAARNFELCRDNATSPYFCWLGAHDLLTNDYLSEAVSHLRLNTDTALVYPQNAVYVDSLGDLFESGFYAGFPACSRIDTSGITDPLARATFVIRKIGACTNFHGVFKTEVARSLPLRPIVSGDVLVIALASLYGHIRQIPIQGIRRRVIRSENDSEKEVRYRDVGLINPVHELVGLHLRCVLESSRVSVFSWIRHGIDFKDALEFKFGTNSPHMHFLKSVRREQRVSSILSILRRFVSSPGSIVHRPTLGALTNLLRGVRSIPGSETE